MCGFLCAKVCLAHLVVMQQRARVAGHGDAPVFEHVGTVGDAVLWAVNHNPQITNGTGADTFSPDNPCTRGQIVTFLYRYMK